MTKLHRALACALPLALGAACSAPATPEKAAAAVTTSLPGGTPLEVDLAAPASGALVASPPGSVHASGTVSVGHGEPQPGTLLVYVLDATAASGSAAECGAETTVLGCERAALAALNERAAALRTVAEVGAVLFGASGQPLDVGPGDGVQLLAPPDADANGAGGPDVLEALGTVLPGGTATKFSPVAAGAGPAQLGSALVAGLSVAAASDRPAKVVVLLSASTSAAGPAAADVVVPEGVAVRAFALPGTTCAAGLADFAARGGPGSACEDVPDLGALPQRVAAVLDAELVAVDLGIDGVFAPLGAITLPAAAPFEASFETLVEALAPGAHVLCVRVSGRDAGGEGGAEACADVKVATVAVSPLEATHELGTPGQTATVTAAVVAGEAGGVAGVPVVFAVKEGPNAGKGATIPTDADGIAAFTYEARQHLEGLGTDAIEACFADAEGNEACAAATVTWQDTTPPLVSCIPGPNPGGVVHARGDSPGPSGFMRLVAVDAVDPDPLVSLVDTGSGTVWGPFASGYAVKYTEAPGAKPSAKGMGGGHEILHVTGNGDPALVGRDAVGNESDRLVCPVPPWKK